MTTLPAIQPADHLGEWHIVVVSTDPDAPNGLRVEVEHPAVCPVSPAYATYVCGLGLDIAQYGRTGPAWRSLTEPGRYRARLRWDSASATGVVEVEPVAQSGGPR